MEQKELIAYAAKMDEKFNVPTINVEVTNMRKKFLKRPHPKLCELIEALKEDLDCRLWRCYSLRFKQYEYNWFDVYISKYNLGIKFCKDQKEKDIAFQLYKRLPILLFVVNDELTIDAMLDEIIKKIAKIGDEKEEKK